MKKIRKMAASRCKKEMKLKERRREGNEFIKLLFPNKRFENENDKN